MAKAPEISEAELYTEFTENSGPSSERKATDDATVNGSGANDPTMQRVRELEEELATLMKEHIEPIRKDSKFSDYMPSIFSFCCMDVLRHWKQPEPLPQPLQEELLRYGRIAWILRIPATPSLLHNSEPCAVPAG